MNGDIVIGDIHAYRASAGDGGPHPGLILIHEIWGLVDHIRNVANRFAAAGYTVVAPNLFHGTTFDTTGAKELAAELFNPATRDAAQAKMRALTAPIRMPEFAAVATAKLKRCVDYMLKDEPVGGQVAVVGFCFGGTYSFHLAANDRRIKAAVPFYGQPPGQDEIARLQCPVLAFYGDQDAGLMETLPQLKDDMKTAGKRFDAVVYEGAGHAFFNDENARMYRPRAAADSWEGTLAFLDDTLGA